MPRGRKPREDVDWYVIEREYSQGLYGLNDIAEKHNISTGSIRRRAKSEGWVRGSEMRVGYNPMLQVKDEFVARDILQREHGKIVKRVSAEMQRQIFAETQARIEGVHAEKLEKLREVSDILLSKFEQAVNDLDMSDPDRISPAAANSLFTKVIGANKDLIDLERRVYRIQEMNEQATRDVGIEIRHTNMLDIAEPED